MRERGAKDRENSRPQCAGVIVQHVLVRIGSDGLLYRLAGDPSVPMGHELNREKADGLEQRYQKARVMPISVAIRL